MLKVGKRKKNHTLYDKNSVNVLRKDFGQQHWGIFFSIFQTFLIIMY